ncbi:hypothetical protein COU61_03235 [Candidatus Pacearchaeota archaeon CG10_big_fil_rev_8_21_14_0_10_35_13]|nr:MAG: hypothetical protein COU61_03235 [Candidatus Pacearchaeota archaeon CG10_big_fil_rev_8_21_14_0_10_35_13]
MGSVCNDIRRDYETHEDLISAWKSVNGYLISENRNPFHIDERFGSDGAQINEEMFIVQGCTVLHQSLWRPYGSCHRYDKPYNKQVIKVAGNPSEVTIVHKNLVRIVDSKRNKVSRGSE